jgi:outer membrane protein assembly factor BamD (BamD/ComL family)
MAVSAIAMNKRGQEPFAGTARRVLRTKGSRRLFFIGVLYALASTSTTGCAWDQWEKLDRWHWVTPPPAPPPPADSLILRGDRLESETAPAAGSSAATLAGAREMYRQGEFAKAEKIFHKIADNTKNSPSVAEEARYYEAECLRRQARYPKAADTYNKMLIDFPSGAYREQAVQHMFEIANYWLEDTRHDMEKSKELKEGKRWVVWPDLVHFEKTKPLVDEEGRALEKLEQVRYNDMTGPMADKALFLAGSVKFFREDYKEADHYYSQLVEMHPNSPFAQQALELGILSKQLSTGGPAYDGRKVAEARRLVDTALRNYPDLASKKADFLNRQLYSITLQQAAKDYECAEFYRRTNHPCSAYFCYEVVRRRYPGTKYCDLATQRMNELRAKLEKTAAEDSAKSSSRANRDTRPMVAPPNQGPGQGEIGPPARQMPLEMLK